MPYLNVRVVDGDDDPVAGERVMLVIHHGGLKPPTHMTEDTDSDGVANFDFNSGVSADVYVRGSLELERVGLDGEVSVSV